LVPDMVWALGQILRQLSHSFTPVFISDSIRNSLGLQPCDEYLLRVNRQPLVR
jgi:hypothetical protein